MTQSQELAKGSRGEVFRFITEMFSLFRGGGKQREAGGSRKGKKAAMVGGYLLGPQKQECGPDTLPIGLNSTIYTSDSLGRGLLLLFSRSRYFQGHTGFFKKKNQSLKDQGLYVANNCLKAERPQAWKEDPQVPRADHGQIMGSHSTLSCCCPYHHLQLYICVFIPCINL